MPEPARKPDEPNVLPFSRTRGSLGGGGRSEQSSQDVTTPQDRAHARLERLRKRLMAELKAVGVTGREDLLRWADWEVIRSKLDELYGRWEAEDRYEQRTHQLCPWSVKSPPAFLLHLIRKEMEARR